MKTAVIIFPGSNCDRDMAVALERWTGHAPHRVWHRETSLPDGLDFIALPGGFSYGDYLRCGAMAANSPIMPAIRRAAEEGRFILGVCNGFQVLCESHLLPGALLRNAGQTFICRPVHLRAERESAFLGATYAPGSVARIPIAHHDGNYFADEDTLDQLEQEGRIAFRYCGEDGRFSDAANPNGSRRHIAGITNKAGNVLGMMPHPERVSVG